MTTPAPVRTIKLKDGRTLGFQEYGDPTGAPCIYTSGSPASGSSGAVHHTAAERHRVRWIQPGFGHSTYQPDRTLLNWADDIEELANHLGLERFAVAGESGGGPYALALAAALEARITTTIVMAGMGPADDPDAVAGMNPFNKALFTMARRAPWLLRASMGMVGRAVSNPLKAESFIAKRAQSAPEVDREVFLHPAMQQGVVDAFREGPRAAAQEFEMFARPWGFALADVRGHVDLFHGEQDTNVPVAIARTVASRLPDCTARFYTEYGHAVGFFVADDVMLCALNAA